MLEITNITKIYKEEQALNNVTLALNEGKIFALLGRNGAGKTTLMKIVLRLVLQNIGDVQYNSRHLTREDLKKEISWMIEGPSFYENLNALDNLKIQALYRDINSENKINECLEIVGLNKEKYKKFNEYSLGMKQRLSIASCLLNNANLLILDEPTNGLDPIGIQEVRKLLLGLKNKGCTIMISSHVLAELEQIVDEIAIIDKGIILKVISEDELEEMLRAKIYIEPVSQELINYLTINNYLFRQENNSVIIDTHKPSQLLMNDLINSKIPFGQYYLKNKSLEMIFKEITGGEGIA